METTLEVLGVSRRYRRNWKWSDKLKARIMVETLVPGSGINQPWKLQVGQYGSKILSKWVENFG